MRRELPPDRGLEARMLVALLLLVAFYVGIGVLFWLPAAFDHSHTTPPVAYGTAMGVLLAALIYSHFMGADVSTLSAVHARRLWEDDDPELRGAVERLSALADVRPPKIALSDLPTPNALATGLRTRRRTIVVTESLRELLSREELEAVLAHELTHLLNGDARLMTAATSFRSVVSFFGERPTGVALERGSWLDPAAVAFWIVFAPIRLLLRAVGTALAITISRYREYSADRGSAVLTGRPEALMSALVRLAGAAPPDADLRASSVNALWIVPVRRRRFSVWLSDHPPLERRLARLEMVAREMGRPQAPRAGARPTRRRDLTR